MSTTFALYTKKVNIDERLTLYIGEDRFCIYDKKADKVLVSLPIEVMHRLGTLLSAQYAPILQDFSINVESMVGVK